MGNVTERHLTPQIGCAIAGFAALLLMLLLPSMTAWAQQTPFTVTVADKTSEHPYAGQGWPEGYVVDGVQGKVLTLIRGRTYTFQMQDVPAIHPFILTTDEAGGPNAEPYTEGVTGSGATGNETLTFTPDENTPDDLYYQCGFHEFMGSQIRIVDEQSAELELMAEGLTAPVALVEPPDESGRRFIVEQTGQIWILGADGTLLQEPFLDLSGQIVELMEAFDERGLLGLAFHPDYASNGRFFVYYSAPLRDEAPDDFNHTSHISEFTVSNDPNRADPGSEQILLQVDQPQFNHNAGTLAFGPADGFLYISLGDGGGANDVGVGHVDDWYDFNEGGNGQDLEQNLLGSILRIDVDNPSGDRPYGIPDDNPFGDEQYAYGFRNPFRFSFDMEADGDGMHRLLVGNAGQELWEEVSLVERGGNYGWNVKEGTHCFDAANPEDPPDDCPDTVGAGHPDEGAPLIDPVIEFANAKQEGGLGLVVVGGHVYRGTMLPGLSGSYVFGAWSRGRGEEARLPGRIFVAEPRAEGLWPFSELRITNMAEESLTHFVLSFGQDRSGEVYVLTTDEAGPTGNTGRVYRLVPPGTVATEAPDEIPSTIVLEQNYPNPFNPSTRIRFRLTEQAQVTLAVYDVMGREIARLIHEPMVPGEYTVEWDGTNEAGRPVASGTYLYQLRAGTAVQTRGMTLLR